MIQPQQLIHRVHNARILGQQRFGLLWVRLHKILHIHKQPVAFLSR